MRRLETRSPSSALLALCMLSAAASPAGADTLPLPEARVRFEQTATDADVEVVFEVTAGNDGLAMLTVRAPDGRIVVDFRAPDATTLGMRSFRFESPEPKDVAGLKAAYPEGVYTFEGTSAGGTVLQGTSTLHHALPKAASFLHPSPEAENVAADALEIRWSAVAGVAFCWVEIEDDASGTNVTARVPGGATRFAVPPGLLQSGVEYQLSLGMEDADGNLTFVETSFVTAGPRARDAGD